MRNMKLAVVLVISLSTFNHAKGQASPESSPHTRVSADELHKYMREPNGLEKLSAKVGDVEINDEEEVWGQDDLSSLTQRSDVILAASISHRRSYLSQDGDSIDTQYELHPREALKGRIPSNPAFTTMGGSVVLSNGHTVTVHSELADELKLNGTYIFFFKEVDGRLTRVPSAQSALHLLENEDKVELVKNRPIRDSKLTTDLGGLTIATVREKIRNIGMQ